MFSIHPRHFAFDLDCFFVAVERAQDPSLNGKLVVVGAAPGQRGVIACASYEARAFGLKAGMPLAQARRLCPQAIFLQGHFDRYLEVSRDFMAILQEYSPFIQPMGLDEAYLDMTGFESLYGPPAEVAMRIKARVRNELKVTVSVGIASSKVTAKVASDACKPDGLLEVPPGGDAAFLAPRPIEELPGVGEKTLPTMRRLSIHTIGNLAATDPVVLRCVFGKWGDILHLSANGIEHSPITEAPAAQKSISRETTFPHDTHDIPFIKSTLRYLAERVGAELRREEMRARHVVLKLRWDDFTTLTRHHTFRQPADTDEAIYDSGLALLLKELSKDPRQVRLIGIGVGGLTPRERQLALMESPTERYQRLALALDSIRDKYGYTAIQRGLTFALKEEFPEEHGRYLLATAALSR